MANPYPANFETLQGARRLTGQVDFTDPANQPGGGSQPILLTSVSLSAAQIVALNTTAINLLPTPGGRFYYVPTTVVLHYRFGTTPYTGQFIPVVGFGARARLLSDVNGEGAGVALSLAGLGADFGVPPANSSGLILQQTADAYLFGTAVGGFLGYWNEWLATSIENQPLAITNDTGGDGTPVAGGDGTLTVRVFYALIDGAP